MSDKLDLIIVGAGIAGVSAAVYARRSGLTFEIFEPKLVGGQLFYMEKIDNYVGAEPGITGAVLAQRLSDTLENLEISVQKEKVKEIRQKEGFIVSTTNNKQYYSRAVIAATGASFKKLNIEGEDKFTGSGVSYCAVCDGFFFKEKDVAVIGGGNTAVEEALYLSNFANSVTLIHRRDKLRALDYLQKKLKEKNNIRIIYKKTVSGLEGDNKLQGLVLSDEQGKESQLSVEGLFVAIGVLPNTDFCDGFVSTDDWGFIVTDDKMKTSQGSFWACGDCRSRPLRQLITAASEGAIASIEAYKKIKGSYLST